MQLLIVAALAAAAGAVQNIAGFGAGIILMLVVPDFYGILGAPALNIAICTTAQTDEEARELLRLMGAPFVNA